MMTKLLFQEFQSEAEAEFRGLIGADTDMVTGCNEATESVEPENKIKDDDIDLALDALRNCDTDFIKFDEVNLTQKNFTRISQITFSG